MNGLWLVSYVGLWLMVMLLAVAMLALLRQIGLLHMRIQPAGARTADAGPEIGEQLPETSIEDVFGELVSVVKYGRSRLLLFVAPSCSSCEQLLPSLRTFARRETAVDDVVLLTGSEDQTANENFIRRHKLQDFPYIASWSVANNYHVRSSPYAVIVDQSGIVRAKGVVNHAEHLESLVNALHTGHATLESYLAEQNGVTSHAN